MADPNDDLRLPDIQIRRAGYDWLVLLVIANRLDTTVAISKSICKLRLRLP